MKIEIGKRYVTRDGQISSPILRNHAPEYPFQTTVDFGSLTYNKDGLRYNSHFPNGYDLISEYQPTMTKGLKYYTDNAAIREFLIKECGKMGYQSGVGGPVDAIGVFSCNNGNAGFFTKIALMHDDPSFGFITSTSVEEFLSKAKEFIQKSVTVPLNSEYTATWTGGNTVKVGCQSIPVDKVLELADKIREARK